MQTSRQQLFTISQKLAEFGLNNGASGNASVRLDENAGGGFLVTPSGLSIGEMSPESMVHMHLDGKVKHGNFEQNKKSSSQLALKPSSEWRFHRDILASRPEVKAIIHTHSMFATTLACLHKDIPAFHYMIAVAGGDNIRCAPYALFGSQQLSENALTALIERKACLLANHGIIALGHDLDDALAVAVEVENLCEQYWRILQVNPNPPLLSEAEMREVFQQFKGYGKWSIK